jgi:hypothetical protein
MIASQKIGKSFMGAFNYNLKKLSHPNREQRAELLATNFSSLDPKRVRQEIELIRGMRPSLGKYVYHTSLNFSKEEAKQLSNEKLSIIAKEYLKEMGYVNNQYMIFRHHDADHPHIHLLVNRITFDGEVVSDSNNYKRSEALIRKLEKTHGLMQLTSSSYLAVSTPNTIKVIGNGKTFNRAPKKDEIEMVVRTHIPSGKMLLQEKLSLILKQPKLSLQDFIQQSEASGINILFNQASTGYISGITFFNAGFKAKGQALGSKYKWSELLKQLNYEQIRDREAVSQANERTRIIYGGSDQNTGTGESYRKRNAKPVSSDGQDTKFGKQDIQRTDGTSRSFEAHTGRLSTGNKDTIDSLRAPATIEHDNFGYSDHITIIDDADDEQIYGKERRRGRGK